MKEKVSSSLDNVLHSVILGYTIFMTNPIHPYAIYDSKQAADLLGVEVVTIQRYIRAGKLQATKLGKVYRISGHALLDLMSLEQDGIQNVQDRVRKTEAANYIRAKSYLLSQTKGKECVELFNLTADTLIASLEPSDDDTEDVLAVKYIGTRIFNTAMAAYRDALSGYYQVSFANQRDLIEIQFLLDYFRDNRSEIKAWREADNQKRIELFSPGRLRKLLDERDGFTEKKREKRYKQFCELAAHVSYPGFKLLANQDNLIEIGAFYDEKKLLNTVYDLCMNFGYDVIAITAVLKVPSPHAAELWIKHAETFDKVFNLNITQNEKFQAAKENIDQLLKQLIEK